MAISHVCMGCGLDLARVRAAADPHYGLPMVACPRCAWACVRRHPSLVGWRGSRAGRRAVVGLSVQVAFVVGSAAVTTMASVSMAAERFTPRVAVEQLWSVVCGDEDVLAAAPSLAPVAWAAFVGAWLSATLRHLGVLTAIVLWGVVVQCVLLGVGIVEMSHHRVGGQPGPQGTLTLEMATQPLYLWRVAAAAGVVTLLTPVGVPLGLAVRAGLEARRRRWVTRMLRRRRPGRAPA